MGRSSRKKRSTRRQSRIASLMIVAAVVMVCIISIVVVTDLQGQSRELSMTEHVLMQEIEQAKLEKENLIAQEQYMKTNKYVEDVAKDKLGLVYPDEIVIKPYE